MLVERLLGKQEVRGSTPRDGSSTLARWSVGRARLALNQDQRRRFDSYRVSLRGIQARMSQAGLLRLVRNTECSARWCNWQHASLWMRYSRFESLMGS